MTAPAALISTLKLHRPSRQPDILPSGIPPLDRITQGIPRGAISEIAGPESSGRVTLANTLLASATNRLEICAYVDTDDSFDPYSAAAAGVLLPQLLWVRCGHSLENALKTVDLLLHAGGFGVVALDLAHVSDRFLRRIPISHWHRFRLALENTPTVLAVLEREAQAKSTAAMILDLTRKQAVWSGTPGFHLLRDVQIEAGCRKPMRPGPAAFMAHA